MPDGVVDTKALPSVTELVEQVAQRRAERRRLDDILAQMVEAEKGLVEQIIATPAASITEASLKMDVYCFGRQDLHYKLRKSMSDDLRRLAGRANNG
jgi:hypothetical protein